MSVAIKTYRMELVGFHAIPLLTFDLQVKLFTHQPPSNDGGWCAGFLGSPISLFNRAKYHNWPQMVAPQFREAWRM